MPSTISRMNVAGTHMEDEAGEEFNNTYLKDLKCGSDFSLDKNEKFDVCSASVLQQEKFYVSATYERFLCLWSWQNLDDSDALLLQSQHRKKQSTSYKRPGPPTPSKNAGRLSLGGGSTDIHYTNILKESGNIDKQTHWKNDGIFVTISKGKDELQSPSTRVRKLRTLTPKINKKSIAWIIDDTDTECNETLTTAANTKELNRTEEEMKPET
ncbi:hypothetical protein PVAND_017284 [Polypedilum vanderplanki]|uniref:Uncharacterized protein n=1 Tax=Polypedilum vanderplanki TaxID=319348 RepID=A0A9J6BHU7_POLVA|nr:hypothetical protein PVAND_017284 [Polypedilum vanderplanki]